jgi:hypothetical protein
MKNECPKIADLRKMQQKMKDVQYLILNSCLPLERKIMLQDKANVVAFEILTAIQMFSPETKDAYDTGRDKKGD